MPTNEEIRYVWVVHYDNYGDRWLVGVFDSEDKVTQFRPKDPERPWHCDYEIAKTRLNPTRTMADELA
jgi:uncharacterized short protein YbdD (DUF466 family)